MGKLLTKQFNMSEFCDKVEGVTAEIANASFDHVNSLLSDHWRLVLPAIREIVKDENESKYWFKEYVIETLSRVYMSLPTEAVSITCYTENKVSFTVNQDGSSFNVTVRPLHLSEDIVSMLLTSPVRREKSGNAINDIINTNRDRLLSLYVPKLINTDQSSNLAAQKYSAEKLLTKFMDEVLANPKKYSLHD